MRYRTKIKAGKISNLTDARYFAAMGVDYLGINLDALDHPVPEFLDIIQWVEGPTIVAESLLYTLEDWQTFEEFTQVEWTQSKLPLKKKNILGIKTLAELGDNGLFYCSEEISADQLSALSADQRARLIIGVNRDSDVLQSVAIEDLYAIEIGGSSEEKLGMKDFESVDHLFEMLEL